MAAIVAETLKKAREMLISTMRNGKKDNSTFAAIENEYTCTSVCVQYRKVGLSASRSHPIFSRVEDGLFLRRREKHMSLKSNLKKSLLYRFYRLPQRHLAYSLSRRKRKLPSRRTRRKPRNFSISTPLRPISSRLYPELAMRIRRRSSPDAPIPAKTTLSIKESCRRRLTTKSKT